MVLAYVLPHYKQHLAEQFLFRAGILPFNSGILCLSRRSPPFLMIHLIRYEAGGNGKEIRPDIPPVIFPIQLIEKLQKFSEWRTRGF